MGAEGLPFYFCSGNLSLLVVGSEDPRVQRLPCLLSCKMGTREWTGTQ